MTAIVTDFLQAIPLTNEVTTQISTLLPLCQLQNEMEKANSLVHALQNVKCAKIFYEELKQYTNQLQSNIIHNLPKIPTKHNLNILSTASSIPNPTINNKVINIIHDFATKNRDKDIAIQLIANCQTFAIFNKFLSSDHNDSKILTINCLQIILSHDLTFSNTNILIPLLIQHIHCKDTTVQGKVMALIQGMCHKKYKEYRTMFLNANILDSFKLFYQSKYLSFDSINNVSIIVERLCKQSELSTQHFFSLLVPLQFMIYFDDNYIIECALIGYSYLSNHNRFNTGYRRAINLIDTAPFKKQYEQQSLYENIIFNVTMQKCFIPSELKKVIQAYYCSFNSSYVAKIDFCFQRRFVQLLGNEYKYYVKRCSLECIKTLLNLPQKESVFNQMIFFGLLNKLELVLRYERHPNILEKALWIVLIGIDNEWFCITYYPKLMDEINKIAKNYQNDFLNAMNALDVIAVALAVYVERDDTQVMFNNEFIGGFVDTFLQLIKYEKIDKQLWRDVTFAIETVSNANDNNSEIIQSRLRQCNLSEIHKDDDFLDLFDL